MPMPGSPGKHLEFYCRSSEAGRRRASSAVAALQSTTRVTALLGRRWAAADQKAGVEGNRNRLRQRTK